MISRKHQSGFSLALVAAIILVLVAVYVAVKIFERTETAATRTAETQTKFTRVHAALLSYVAANQRLPCPANPILDDGLADPAVASLACNSPGGTLPWATLGMNRDDGYDAWGWKISYRVFNGGIGSLTQAEGASMVKCECNINAVGAVCEPTPAPPTPTGLCSSSADPLTYATTESLFLATNRLQVNDFGINHTDAAYVLVSHGPSGLGAYTAAGVRRTDMAITNPAELGNTANAGPFTAMAPVLVSHGPSGTIGIPPDNPLFFDDVISYVALSSLIHNAGLGGRDWPDPPVIPLTGATMTNAAVAAAIGSPGPVAPGSLGTGQAQFGSGTGQITIRAADANGSQDLSFEVSVSTGVPGLGVAGNGNNLMTSFNNESLSVDFGLKGTRLAVALADLGTYVDSGVTYTEQVQFQFSGGASIVNVTKSGCRADGGVATFSIDPGTDFNHVNIVALVATPAAPNENTATALADIQLCDASAGACLSTLATPTTACP